MKSLSKMNTNELRQTAIELGVDKNRTYGTSKQGLIIMINAQKDINDAIESGLIETNTSENKKEETTMTNTTFTTNSGMTYSISGTRYFKAGLDGRKTRISKTDYELAQDLYAKEQAEAQAKLDEEPCHVDPMADLQKPAVLNEYGCVDCSECGVKVCVHRDCMRRNPRSEGGLGECPRLDVKPEEEETPDAEIEQIKAEIPGIEAAEAELMNNIKKEKKARKPRRSKDIAYEGHGITLTAKQVDFIHHIPDTNFYESIESGIFVDILCDEIGGQFAGKPMTVGAMISTLCEKGLGGRYKDTSRQGKPIVFSFSDLGQEIAKELGLE